MDIETESHSDSLKLLNDRIESLERRNRAMCLLLEMLEFLQSAPDLETMLRIVLTCVTSGYTLGFNRAYLFLMDVDGGHLKGKMAVGPTNAEEASQIWRHLAANTRSLKDQVEISRLGGRDGDRKLSDLVSGISIDVASSQSILAECIRIKDLIVVTDPSSLSPDDVVRMLEPSAFVCVPMISSGKPTGLILADNSITCSPPTDERLVLLRALAWQAGQMVERASYQDDIKRRLDELSTITEIAKLILSTTDLETELGLIARISAQALNARGAALRLLEEDGALVTKAIFCRTLGEVESDDGSQCVAEYVTRENRPLLLGSSDLAGYGLVRRKNLICVPLSKGNNVIGTLTVFDKYESEILDGDGFTKDDLRFLTVLGGQAAIAIDNARLFESLKQKEEHIKELHKHLLRSERLAALGELSSQVAHEIRNPLAAIGGFARSVRRNMPDDHRDAKALDVIIAETIRLERILNEHLTFAKLSPPELRPENVNRVIEETIDLLREAILEKKANLEVNLASDLPLVNIDADKIKQVFINILQNAIDTISEGGSIRVSSNRLDRTIEVRFENDGPTIPKDILDRLFVPFVTTREGGSGLGLAIAYEIVYENGGTIDVESEEGKGTVFLVTFPLVVEGDRRKGPIDRRSIIRDRRRFGRKPWRETNGEDTSG
ncbi:MAG: ATP-binding protein [bacterium]